jgi:N-methylhydantoinase B
MIRPYFHGKRIVAYGWCFVHCTDIGGAVPSSIAPSLSEIFQEGLIIPPMKFLRRGKMNDDLLALIMANNREPEVNMGDILAMLGTLETAEGRVAELIERHGLGTFLDAQGDLQDYTAAKARDVLRRIPDGVYEFWDFMDDDRVSRIPLRVRVKLTVKDGRLDVDLTGTDPQVRAAYNVPTNGKRNYWISLRLTNFLTTYDQTMAKNVGLYRSIRAIVPPGILLNAEFPDACGVRSSPPLRISGAINGAILKAQSDLLPAPSDGCTLPLALSEFDATGGRRTVAVIEPVRGGMGAMKGQDGVDARDTSLNNMRNHPVETVENDMGVVFRRYDVGTDSGGPGRWRGGVGQVITFEVLRDGGRVLSRGMERLRFPAYGVCGGKPGGRMRAILNLGRANEEELTKFDQLEVNAGDTVTFMMPGGGGYGDPFERDPERVQEDVETGFVGRQAARRDYGVAIGNDGAVDEAATAKLRARRVKDNIGVDFDFGPEREAWERVFDDEIMGELNRRLFELPKSIRQDKRRWIIEQAVPEIPIAGTGSLADALADADAARRRLKHAMAQAFGSEEMS